MQHEVDSVCADLKSGCSCPEYEIFIQLVATNNGAASEFISRRVVINTQRLYGVSNKDSSVFNSTSATAPSTSSAPF